MDPPAPHIKEIFERRFQNSWLLSEPSSLSTKNFVNKQIFGWRFQLVVVRANFIVEQIWSPPHTQPHAPQERKRKINLLQIWWKNIKTLKIVALCIPIFVCHDFPQVLSSVFPFFLPVQCTPEEPHMKFCLSCDLRLFLWTSSPALPRKLKRQGEHSEFLIPGCQFFSFQKQEFLFADFNVLEWGLKYHSLEWMVF